VTDNLSIEEKLRLLLDEREIRTVLARYARGIDRMDYDLVRSCYHKGATDDHGHFRGSADGFVAHLHESLSQFESSQHFLGTQLIEIAGDEARTETYCLALLRFSPHDEQPAIERSRKLRYCDRFERRDGEWKITERVVVFDFDRIDPVENSGGTTQMVIGSRDEHDPAVAPVLPQREPQEVPWQ
jgi:hypothetical protein